ncbi:hypothetical protein ABPG74_021185 [Tetrahymena malaccensis]
MALCCAGKGQKNDEQSKGSQTSQKVSNYDQNKIKDQINLLDSSNNQYENQDNINTTICKKVTQTFEEKFEQYLKQYNQTQLSVVYKSNKSGINGDLNNKHKNNGENSSININNMDSNSYIQNSKQGQKITEQNHSNIQNYLTKSLRNDAAQIFQETLDTVFKPIQEEQKYNQQESDQLNQDSAESSTRQKHQKQSNQIDVSPDITDKSVTNNFENIHYISNPNVGETFDLRNFGQGQNSKRFKQSITSNLSEVVKTFQIDQVAYEILTGTKHKQIQGIKIKYSINQDDVLKLEFKYDMSTYRVLARIRINDNSDEYKFYLHNKIDEYKQKFFPPISDQINSIKKGRDILEYKVFDISTKQGQL